MEPKVQSGTVLTGTSVWHPVDEQKPAETESEPSPGEQAADAGHGDTFESGGTPGASRHGNVEFNF
jgi:hypothetical protein